MNKKHIDDFTGLPKMTEVRLYRNDEDLSRFDDDETKLTMLRCLLQFLFFLLVILRLLRLRRTRFVG
jgi:hypothetical protein